VYTTINVVITAQTNDQRAQSNKESSMETQIDKIFVVWNSV